MNEPNPYAEFIGSLPEAEQSRASAAFVRGFLAMLQAEDIARERGKDPVGWAFKRLDFAGSPFRIHIEREQFCDQFLVPCRLSWWPDGERGHYIEERPPRAEVYEPISTALSASIKRHWVEVKQLRYDLTFQAVLAFDEPDAAVTIIAREIVQQHTGFLPRVKSQRETHEALSR